MTTSRTDPVTSTGPSARRSLLRTALALDALVAGVNGAAYLSGAAMLHEQIGLPPALLRVLGGFLLAYGLALGLLATRPQIRRDLAWAVVAVNAVWAADSLLLVALDWGTPTTAGAAWIALQALVVVGFASAQRAGLRAEPRTGSRLATLDR